MKSLYLLLLLLTVGACSPATGQIERITPIPTDELTLVASTPAPPTTVAANATPTSALAALAELGKNAATATPLDNNLLAGQAMEIAAATDSVMKPEIENPLSFDRLPVGITFDEFYDGYDLRTGLILSDKLKSLDGQKVVMEGYMAPPLKPQLDYFVLTRIRLAFCPFCSNASDWPDDIALVYLPDQTTTATQHPVRITGRMEVGASVDGETGMVSLVRIYADALEILG
jgi:hypothetical protein